MSKRKWHDMTVAHGDPNDFPTRNGAYLVTLKSGQVHEYSLDIDDGDDMLSFYESIIAWREMPEAYVYKPSKEKLKSKEEYPGSFYGSYKIEDWTSDKPRQEVSENSEKHRFAGTGWDISEDDISDRPSVGGGW